MIFITTLVFILTSFYPLTTSISYNIIIFNCNIILKIKTLINENNIIQTLRKGEFFIENASMSKMTR